MLFFYFVLSLYKLIILLYVTSESYICQSSFSDPAVPRDHPNSLSQYVSGYCKWGLVDAANCMSELYHTSVSVLLIICRYQYRSVKQLKKKIFIISLSSILFWAMYCYCKAFLFSRKSVEPNVSVVACVWHNHLAGQHWRNIAAANLLHAKYFRLPIRTLKYICNVW